MQSMTLPNDIIDKQFERIFGYIEQNMAANWKKSDKENTMNFNKSSLKRQLEDSQQKMNNKSTKSQHLDCQTTEDDDKSKLMICNICTKTFSKSGHLKRHIYTVHEGHKDYKCESCGKSFSEAGHTELKYSIAGVEFQATKQFILSSFCKMI